MEVILISRVNIDKPNGEFEGTWKGNNLEIPELDLVVRAVSFRPGTGTKVTVFLIAYYLYINDPK